jgi:hypothetical protein
MTATTKATSSPAVMLMSMMSNTTGPWDQAKNTSHVFLYASIPLDWKGGGTSNIKISGEW